MQEITQFGQSFGQVVTPYLLNYLTVCHQWYFIFICFFSDLYAVHALP